MHKAILPQAGVFVDADQVFILGCGRRSARGIFRVRQEAVNVVLGCVSGWSINFRAAGKPIFGSVGVLQRCGGTLRNKNSYAPGDDRAFPRSKTLRSKQSKYTMVQFQPSKVMATS